MKGKSALFFSEDIQNMTGQDKNNHGFHSEETNGLKYVSHTFEIFWDITYSSQLQQKKLKRHAP